MRRAVAKIPGPKGYPLLGVALDFKRDPLKLLSDVSRDYGDLVRLRLGANTMYLVNRAEYVNQVLKLNAHNYGKQNLMYRAMSTLFGEATAIVDGERWKQGFQLIQPSFTQQASERAVPQILKSVEKLVDEWSRRANGAEGDFAETISAMTLDIIVGSMFGQSLGPEEAEIARCFRTLVDFIAHRVLSVVKLPLRVPIPRHRAYAEAIRRLDTVMYRVIEERLRAPAADDASDLLSNWIAASQSGRVPGVTPRLLRDEVIGIFVAAHGSTAVFLSWILYHLGRHPEIQSRARAEVQRVFGKGAPSVDRLSELTYVTQVIEESMRLSPPGWIISRSSIKADRLGDYDIPAGAMLLISPYLIHHRADYWERPEQFDPERFSPDKAVDIRRATQDCRYIPFAAGKRVCTGKVLAMVESKIIISRLLQAFEWLVPPWRESVPEGRFTLNLKGGLNLAVRPAGGGT